MRKRIGLGAMIATGIVFLAAALVALPRDMATMSIVLKAAVVGSAVAFMATVVTYMLWK